MSGLVKKRSLTIGCAMDLEPDLNNCICSGSFGKIYRMKANSDFVVKIIKISKHNIESNENLIKILKNHPHLLPIEITVKNIQSNEYWIVLPYMCGEDLFDHIKSAYFHSQSINRDQIVTTTWAFNVTYKLLKALEYLHSYGVIHRDVKPENIRLIKISNDPCDLDLDPINVMLYDFGLSEFVADREEGKVSGTPEYIAPEMYYGKYYDERIDIWALGITLHMMMTWNTPQEQLIVDNNDYNALKDTTFLCENLTDMGYSSGLIKLWKKMQAINSYQRPDAEYFLENWDIYLNA